jgi:hypothetical protein
MSDKFKLDYDSSRYINVIKFGSFTILQLQSGTVRNKEFAEFIVEMLNDQMQGKFVIANGPIDKMRLLIREIKKEG